METEKSGDRAPTGNSSRLFRSSFYNFHPFDSGLSVERLSSSQSLNCRDLIGHHGDEGAVNSVEFSDDGSLFTSGGSDGRVLLWPTSKALDEKWTS